MEAKAKALAGRRCVLCGGLALGLMACAEEGGGLSFLSAEEERRLGEREHPRVLAQFGGAMTGPQAEYVTEVGRRLAARSPRADERWTFSLLDDDILNAFALPGGFVYATRGLVGLASNEAEMAGVLGHEIGHVLERHTAERVTGQQIGQGASILGEIAGRVFLGVSGLGGQAVGALSQGLLASFSREQELEADTWGVRLLREDGMNPEAMATFLERMDASNRLDARVAGRPVSEERAFNWLSTHPRTRDRVEQAISIAGANPTGEVNEERHRRRVSGLAWGDDPRQGVFAGGEFVHGEGGYAFRLPQGFRPAGPRVVQRQGVGAIAFSASRTQRAVPAEAYLREVWLREANRPPVQAFQAGQVQGAAAVLPITVNRQQLDSAFIALPLGPQTFARVQCLAPRGRFRQVEEACIGAARSFRRLSAAEVARLRPARIDTVRAGPRDTVATLSQRMTGAPGSAEQKAERFRLMNGLGPTDEVTAGATVKLVVV